ncbi:putative disease resistance protein RGA3 [Phoenix dactylifera]|uniref:Disease resistance protein RGA3 n=1 Tax=Phoenix dactylifera TaxID=42345 RepID=A0A8B8ZWT0_PHODC|nr:putative disease resistance protein RGA3 [Phoenix dactylifera]
MGPELVIAGWFASAAISQLLGLAISYIKERPVWLSMKKQLKKLRAALQRIQAVVERVEKLQVINGRNPAEEAWLWQLKNAVDEASDVLDELEYYKLKEKVKSRGEKVRPTASDRTKKIIRCTAFAFKQGRHLKKKLNRAVKNLDHVADSAGDFLKLHDLSNEHGARRQQIVPPESGCLVTEDKVFGREKEMAKIVGWLKMPESCEHGSNVKNVTVLPIVGAAGMGKTTLAQHVYREGKGSFDLSMWVCVSNNFDAAGIMKKIVRAATRTNPQAEELSTLQEILTEKLESSKFLLVLDDVWNDDDRKKWEDLVAPLKKGKQGSKILLTTRMNLVAEMIVKRHAFAGVNADDHGKLQRIGDQIAKKLWGSPLGAKVVGGMLNSNLNFEFWKEVLENGVFNSIQNEDIQPVLRFSYIQFSPQLQRCFRYCSIFPQDYLFERDELVRMWMAAG